MQYNYKIIYDINKDMWNWRESLKYPFMGVSWIDNIDNDEDRKVALEITGLKKQPAEAILKPYLLAQKNDPNSKLNKFIEIAENDFHNKFTDACLALERITKKPMLTDKFTFYITTFACMPYYYQRRAIFMYDSIEGIWGMPIDGFLHEALHFQFTYYWRECDTSQVSKLSDEQFDYIKEALTVVLDDELRPIITLPDRGYKSQAPFRAELHKFWKLNHDFDKLVDFGMKMLPEFIE